MRTPTLLSIFLPCLLSATLSADDWPQWRGPNRDGVWRETGVIEKFDAPEIKRRWTAEIAAGYSGPTVADGRVYVTDRLTEPEEIERVLCFDWTNGEKLWTHSYPCKYEKLGYRDGPRASVTVDGGRAYALGAVGHLFCFDAVTGKVLWKKDPIADFNVKLQIWGVSAAPLIEGDLVILQIGGQDACIVALDKKTGRRRWATLGDDASYSAPITIEQAGRRVVVCWTATRVVGLDPQTGSVLWQQEVGYTRWPIAIATPVLYKDRLFLCSVDKGSLMLRLMPDRPEIDKLWWRYGGEDPDETESLQALMCTPYLADGYIYGANRNGVFRCIDAKTGDRVWEDRTATTQAKFGTMHIIRGSKHIWIFNDRGELIISRLSPKGFDEISRAKLIDPTLGQYRRRDGVTWSHPAFAYKHVFIRNDEELVCASLAAEGE